MAAHSKVTAQGQISVPAAIRKRLGVGPGSILEWDDDGEHVIVRRAGSHTSEDIHHALFSRSPTQRPLSELNDGVRRYIKRRHASR